MSFKLKKKKKQLWDARGLILAVQMCLVLVKKRHPRPCATGGTTQGC